MPFNSQSWVLCTRPYKNMGIAVLGHIHLTQSLVANTTPEIPPLEAMAIFLDVNPKGQVSSSFS